MGSRKTALAATGAAVLAGLLVACGSQAPMPTPTASASSPSPAPTSVRNELNPQFRPGGSAAANQQFFDATNQALQSAAGKSDGVTIVNTLVAAGFNKADMEVTFDSTAIGLQADSIIVSVRIGEECLLGQFAPGYYAGTIAPVLGTGKCLVGWQRTIDW